MRSFLNGLRVAAAILVVGGIALAPGQANATCVHGCDNTATIMFGGTVATSALRAGDSWGGATGSGPGLQTRVRANSSGGTYGTGEVLIAGASDGCPGGCATFQGRLMGVAGGFQHDNSSAHVRAGGNAPVQALTANHGGSAFNAGVGVRFDGFQPRLSR
jgi:hypothetical protein